MSSSARITFWSASNSRMFSISATISETVLTFEVSSAPWAIGADLGVRLDGAREVVVARLAQRVRIERDHADRAGQPVADVDLAGAGDRDAAAAGQVERLPVLAEHLVALRGDQEALRVGGERAVARVLHALVGLDGEEAGAADRHVERVLRPAEPVVGQVRLDRRDQRAGVERPDRGAGLGVREQHVAEGDLRENLALEAGVRRVRQIVRNDILSDLRREHP